MKLCSFMRMAELLAQQPVLSGAVVFGVCVCGRVSTRVVQTCAVTCHRPYTTNSCPTAPPGSARGHIFSVARGRPFLVRPACLAWFLRKRPTLVQHFPAIHGDSAQTKGTVLLGIVSSSLPHRLQHVKHTLTFCTPAGGTNTSSCQPGRDTLSHFQHATRTGMYD